jgi:hypothetical protein
VVPKSNKNSGTLNDRFHSRGVNLVNNKMSGAKKGQKSENRKHKEQKEKWYRYVCVLFQRKQRPKKRELFPFANT